MSSEGTCAVCMDDSDDMSCPRCVREAIDGAVSPVQAQLTAAKSTIDELRRVLEEARSAALEEAASLCDSVHGDPTVGAYTGAEHCARRIRRVAALAKGGKR